MEFVKALEIMNHIISQMPMKETEILQEQRSTSSQIQTASYFKSFLARCISFHSQLTAN